MSRESIYWVRDKLKGCIDNGWQAERKNAFETKSYCANWDDNNWSGNRAYKSLLIHVPRTGGTSIQSFLEGYTVFADHHLAKDIKLKQTYNDFFFYAILRNPYERLISTYEYIFSGMGYLRKLLSFYQTYQESPDFLNYKEKKGDLIDLPTPEMGVFASVTTVEDLEERIEKGQLWLSIEELNQVPLSTKQSLSFERFVDIITEELWDIMWEPQTSYILDDNDKLIIDYVGRTETFQKDINHIVKYIEEKSSMPVMHPQPLQQLNATSSSHLEPLEYYRNENIKKKVAKYYEKDIDYLKVVF